MQPCGNSSRALKIQPTSPLNTKTNSNVSTNMSMNANMNELWYTTLFCVRCNRSVTITANHTFTDLVMMPQGCTAAHFVTLAVCWYCAKVDNFKGPCGTLSIDEYNDKFARRIESLHEVVARHLPMMSNAFIPGIRQMLPIKEVREAADLVAIRPDAVRYRIMFPVLAIDEMKRPYKMVSVAGKKLADPHPHFFALGTTPGFVRD